MVETVVRCFIVAASLFLAVYWSIGRQLDASPVSPLGRIVGQLFLLILATIAAAPWLRSPKRFSLRTLIIATTLVAAVLGIIVYATR